MCKVSVIVPVYNVENYIRDMLVSVQNQTFKDFEVILVNDGSKDNSQTVIDEFCQKDKRFQCFPQENGGVASARNNGIKQAKGDYVVFYDPDDFIPANALNRMYKAAAAKDADMVIGIMEEKSLGESLIYMHSQALAKRDKIDIMDVHFTGAWSLCHKMFKRSLIVENDIKFEKLTNAEDGVFTYCCLNHAKTVCGCRVVAYNYMKRPFWLEASATQTISSKYLEGLLASHGRILEEATKLADKHLSDTAKKEYLQHLFVRFIEGEMIKGYYRNIWRADENIIPRIAERTGYYRQFITDKQWQEILGRHRDLELEKGYMTPDVLAEIPTVSILISADLNEKQLDLMLGSIYNQQFQRFEVLLPAKRAGLVNPGYLNKRNLHLIDIESDAIAEECAKLGDTDLKDCLCSQQIGNALFKRTAIKQAKGKYIAILDEFAIYTKNSLLNMAEALRRNPKLDFVTMLMKNYDGKEYKQIPCLSAAYGYTKLGKSSYDALTGCDSLFSNKLFRKEVLEDFDFGIDPVGEVAKLFHALNFEKMRKGVMITEYSQEDLLNRADAVPSNFAITVNYAKNERIRQTIEGLKRHLNKDDVKRIKQMLKR